jgi:putative sigma-54 modulation protein
MYSAIDLLADKLDRRVLKFKEKISDHHRANGGVKHQVAE